MSKASVELYHRFLSMADNAEKKRADAEAKGLTFNQGLWHGYRDAYRYAADDLYIWSNRRASKMIQDSVQEKP